jgi:predicted NBD/HSP70 family sugar kinase
MNDYKNYTRKYKGIEYKIANIPELDPEHIPLAAFNRAFLKTADKPFAVAIERPKGMISVYDTFLHGTPNRWEADCYYAERLIKFLMWSRGGFTLTLCGNDAIADYIREVYSANGPRSFDFEFVRTVYDRDLTVVSLPYQEKPAENEQSRPVGRHLDGCRIGFDAGGSDRKVSAVIDGEPVYSEEVLWSPKTESDPDYHYQGILDSFRSAASKMPRVDAIGVSSAGLYIDNRTRLASLFLRVPGDLYEAKVRDIYIRAAQKIGDVPLEVVNDGDVTALAGAMELGDNKVLGIAMGTSEAGGYIDGEGNITGWLNELAFAPVDAQPGAPEDEWSRDIGCGVKYFSQDSVIRLALTAGIELDMESPLSAQLKAVQNLLSQGDPGAKAVFQTIGCYLGHALALYNDFYDIRHVLLLGRVMSGEGGDLILRGAREVLCAEYPDVSRSILLHLPDESSRRVGQSVAAASLASIKK